MKITTVASGVVPLLLTLASPLSHAAIITFDFYDLIKNQNSNISGRLGDGSDYVGPPIAAAYEYFTWDKGLALTVSAQTEVRDDWGATGNYVPAFAYLQPGFAGVGYCAEADCAGGSVFGYGEKLVLDFGEVVEIVNIEFGNGKDETWWPTPEEWEAETGLPWDLDEDYRAYNTFLGASGAPTGGTGSMVGSRDHWSGLLVGDHLEFSRTESSGYFLESITIRTAEADVPEPAMWGLMLSATLSLFAVARIRQGKNTWRDITP